MGFVFQYVCCMPLLYGIDEMFLASCECELWYRNTWVYTGNLSLHHFRLTDKRPRDCFTEEVLNENSAVDHLKWTLVSHCKSQVNLSRWPLRDKKPRVFPICLSRFFGGAEIDVTSRSDASDRLLGLKWLSKVLFFCVVFHECLPIFSVWWMLAKDFERDSGSW